MITTTDTAAELNRFLAAIPAAHTLQQPAEKLIRDRKQRAEIAARAHIEAARLHNNGKVTWDLMAAVGIRNAKAAWRDAPFKLTNQRVIELAAELGMDATEIITGRRAA